MKINNLPPTTINSVKTGISKAKKIVQEAIPNATNTNPFVMDAKATAVKINIQELSLSQLKEKVDKQINPFASENLDKMKLELLYLFDEIAPELKPEIFDCNNPEQLFKLLKDKKTTNEILEHQIKTLENNDLSTDSDLDIAITKSARNIRRFFRAITPKSTNPEVQKLEKEVKSMGIRGVNFSDDIEKAKMVRDAIKDLIEARIPLPYSITITPCLPEKFSGLTATWTGSNGANGHVFLATSEEDELVKIARKMSPTGNKKWISTNNPKHNIFHEIAHAFQGGEKYNFSSDDLKLVKKISKYAATKPQSEAMPEMFAMLMDGQNLTEQQLDLYLQLEGILPNTL